MNWSHFLIAILFTLAVEYVRGGESRSAYYYPDSSKLPKARRLSAANVRSRLKSRAQDIQSIFKHETVFDYVHDPEDGREDSVFTATLAVKSRSPVLVLEELEGHLEDIVCSDSQISLLFDSIEKVDVIRKAIGTTSNFVVVTSHNGCNSDGERATHRVNNIKFDTAGKAVHMEKTRCEWRKAFNFTQVSFSRGHRPEIRKRGQVLFGKRQQYRNSTASNVTESGPRPSISFASMPSGTMRLPSAITKEIDESFIDNVIFPPEFPGADRIIPEGVTVSCKNCTLRGNIEITEGSFSLSGSDDLIPDIIEDTIAFFEDGNVEVVSSGLFAHVEIGVNISLTQNLLSLPMNLPAIPLTPFEIPGVVTFGPMIQPELEASIDLNGAMVFSYGFNLSVPANSTLQVKIPDLSKSTVSGFDETTFHTLPLKSTSPPLSLVMSVTFRPQILLGINTAVGSLTGGIGAFMELPNLTVNITQLSGVDGKCEQSANATTGPGPAPGHIFGNLTNIVPAINLNVGALADIEVDVGTFHKATSTQVVFASTSYPLPTACLSFGI